MILYGKQNILKSIQIMQRQGCFVLLFTHINIKIDAKTGTKTFFIFNCICIFFLVKSKAIIHDNASPQVTAIASDKIPKFVNNISKTNIIVLIKKPTP